VPPYITGWQHYDFVNYLAFAYASCVIAALLCRRQAVAGLLYAGPLKSLQYLGRKLAKAWK
jgi:hypothetical protein